MLEEAMLKISALSTAAKASLALRATQAGIGGAAGGLASGGDVRAIVGGAVANSLGRKVLIGGAIKTIAPGFKEAIKEVGYAAKRGASRAYGRAL